MKAILTLFTLMLLSVAAALAQDNEKKSSFTPQIGIRVGYCTSTVHGAEFDGKWKSGIDAGITADFRIADAWTIRPGVYFAMKGFDEKSAFDINYKVQLNYVEVPLLAVYKKSLATSCALELQAGPYFSYGVSGKADKTKIAYDRYAYYKSFDMYKHFDWGANVGFGFDFNDFYVGTSYDLGFVSIIRHALNHCIMVNVGYTMH